ncbi:MAG: hypothetical protein ACREK5_10745 [Gemmatimonadota bacterium]
MTTTATAADRRRGRYELDYWDEATAKKALDEAFDLADSISKPGLWAWVSSTRRPLRRELEGSFDDINEAFRRRAPALLSAALRRFRITVYTAADAFDDMARPLEREQAGREYVEAQAKARRSNRTAHEPAGASC